MAAFYFPQFMLTCAIFGTSSHSLRYEVALHMPDMFAAVAPVAGGIHIGFLPSTEDSLGSSSSSSNISISSSSSSNGGGGSGGGPLFRQMVSVPVLDIHGRNDTTMPYNASIIPPANARNPTTTTTTIATNGSSSNMRNGSVAISKDGWYFVPRQKIIPLLLHRNGCSSAGAGRKGVHYKTPYDGEQGLYCVAEGECASSGGSDSGLWVGEAEKGEQKRARLNLNRVSTNHHSRNSSSTAEAFPPPPPPPPSLSRPAAVVRCSWDGGHGWPVTSLPQPLRFSLTREH